MKRILKRSFVFIITLVLVFSISVPCFASDTSSGATGWNSWSLKEKTDYCCKVGVDIIASVTGIVHGDTSSYKEYLLDLYAKNPAAGVDNFYEYLAKGLSFNDDTKTWTLSDDLVDFCNTVIVDYDEKVTMMYMYPCRPDVVDASFFADKAQYEAFIEIVNAHPEAYFYIEETNPQQFKFAMIITDGLACVNSNFDLIYASVSPYNLDWTQNATFYHFAFLPGGRYRAWNTAGKFSDYSNFDDFYGNENFIRTGTYANVTLFRSDNIKWEPAQAHWLVSSHAGAINCYKSVADMKKDIGSQFIGRYTDDYSGSSSQTITQSEVNNVVNNYYGGYPSDDTGGGSGSGSDDNGGGSGGGIFDDIISGISSGIGSIVKGIFSIIKELVDAIADAIGSITGSITDLMSLLNGNFTEFLSAVFPFMPSEFVTILVASVTLCMLGVIIKIFKG